MTTNRFWRLNSRPEGSDVSGALSLEREPMPELAEGEVLVKAAYLSMDAGTRMWMTEREDSYQPPLELGTKMVGLVLGHVAASRHDGFAEGDLVRGFGQWAEHSVMQPELAGLVKVDDGIEDIRQHFGVLGFNGWTALWGIKETAAVQAGDNVLVSAAAGSTGVLACQVARILGADVYGLAGGPDKCRWLEEELGITKAIDYKNDDVAAELARSRAESTPILTMSAGRYWMPSCPIWRSTDESRFAVCLPNMKATDAVGDPSSSTRS